MASANPAPISPIRAEDVWQLDRRDNGVIPEPNASGSHIVTVTDDNLFEPDYSKGLRPAMRGEGRSRDRS